MKTALVVCGAAGRMGRTLINLIAQHDGASLAGAVEAAGHPALGRDAGEVAGAGHLGVAITADFGAVTRTDTVALDFTNAAAALGHLRIAVAQRSPIVIGSTGFTAAEQSELDQLAPRTRSVIAPNSSVGLTRFHR